MLKLRAEAYFLEQYSYESKSKEDSNKKITRYGVTFLVYDDEAKRADLIKAFVDEGNQIKEPLNFMDKCEIEASISAANKDDQRRLNFEKFIKVIEPSRMLRAVK